MNAGQISIVVVDDHQVVADALSIVMRGESDLRIVGTAGTIAACLSLTRRTCPDVLLLDVSLPDGNGLTLIPVLKRWCPQTHVLVLTSLEDEVTLLRAVDAGTAGFLAKSAPLAQVLAGIRQAAEGEIVMPPSLLLGLLGRVVLRRTAKTTAPVDESLTQREREILRHLAQAASVVDIAAELNIAPITVRTHIRNLLGKLKAHSRLEAVVLALRDGIIETPI